VELSLGADHDWSSDPGEYLHALFQKPNSFSLVAVWGTDRHRIETVPAPKNPSGQALRLRRLDFILNRFPLLKAYDWKPMRLIP